MIKSPIIFLKKIRYKTVVAFIFFVISFFDSFVLANYCSKVINSMVFVAEHNLSELVISQTTSKNELIYVANFDVTVCVDGKNVDPIVYVLNTPELVCYSHSYLGNKTVEVKCGNDIFKYIDKKEIPSFLNHKQNLVDRFSRDLVILGGLNNYLQTNNLSCIKLINNDSLVSSKSVRIINFPRFNVESLIFLFAVIFLRLLLTLVIGNFICRSKKLNIFSFYNRIRKLGADKICLSAIKVIDGAIFFSPGLVANLIVSDNFQYYCILFVLVTMIPFYCYCELYNRR